MKKFKSLFIVLLITLFYSCGNSDSPNNENNSDGSSNGNDNNPVSTWLIPIEDVKDGGPGKDGIPSIENPNFNLASATTLDDDEIVIGIKIGNTIRAYPHYILDWHEIVNDTFEDEKITICMIELQIVTGRKCYFNVLMVTILVKGQKFIMW